MKAGPRYTLNVTSSMSYRKARGKILTAGRSLHCVVSACWILYSAHLLFCTRSDASWFPIYILLCCTDPAPML